MCIAHAVAKHSYQCSNGECANPVVPSGGSSSSKTQRRTAQMAVTMLSWHRRTPSVPALTLSLCAKRSITPVAFVLSEIVIYSVFACIVLLWICRGAGFYRCVGRAGSWELPDASDLPNGRMTPLARKTLKRIPLLNLRPR